MAEEINLKKLARLLNLSIATVSRALRDSHEIGAQTKERVLSLARELDYQPNLFGSGLRRQKSKTIAVIIPEVANNFFSLCVKGIEEVAREKGYHILIYTTHESQDLEYSFLKSFGNGRVEGVLMSLSGDATDPDKTSEIPELQAPLVMFDRISEKASVTVTMNDFESAYEATTHLLECGCKKIAFLMAMKSLSIGKQRYAGFYQAMKDHGLEHMSNIVDCSEDQNKNFNLIYNLMNHNKPDGVVSSMERLAKTFYLVCNDLSIRIPDEIKIISFSSLDLAPILNPALSTITQPAFEMGKEAATTLFKMIKNSSYIPDNVILPGTLMKRKSTSN